MTTKRNDRSCIVGPLRLVRFLGGAGLSRAELARRLDVNRSTVTWWVSGARSPTLEQAVALECLTARWSEGPIRPSEWIAASRLAAVRAANGGAR